MKYFKGKHILITGGAGFIGSHLVEHLRGYDASLVIIDNFSTGSVENLFNVRDKIIIQKSDIRQIEWKNLLTNHQYDVIFHFAANSYVPPSVERPSWDYNTNLNCTFRLLDVLREIEWKGIFIYASSAAVYGEPAKVPIREDDPTIPISPYGVGKLAAERYVAVFSKLYGLKTASLRFFSVYGPRQYKQVVFDMIAKIIQNPSSLFIHGDGTQVRDFNYVEDAVQAAIIVAERGNLKGEVYNVASGRECSIQELADMLCRILHLKPSFVYSGEVRPGDPEKWAVNISRLKSIGYRPTISLEAGLKFVAEWYQKKIKGQKGFSKTQSFDWQ